jgi:hypothetical protein
MQTAETWSDQWKQTQAERQAADRAVTAQEMPPSTWLIRFTTRTPIGWLYFSPYDGLPDSDPAKAAAGSVTSWHNDPNKALHFPTEQMAENFRLFCRYHIEGDFLNTQTVECRKHPYYIPASGPPE